MDNKKIYLIFTVLAILGLVLALKFCRLAYPIASMDMNFDKEKALEISEKYLRDNNFDTPGYRSSAVFSPNSWDLLFLERSLGLEEANNMIEANTVSIWNWEVRYFQQFNPEEYYFYIDTETGEIVSFNHIIEDITPEEDLTLEEARLIAESYLNNTGTSIDEYELIESSSEKQEARTDHFFEWRKKDFKIPWEDGGNGYLKIKIGIYGDEVGYYKTRSIEYPENFERNIIKQLNFGSFLVLISFAIAFLLGFITFIILFVKKFFRGEDIVIRGVRWKIFLYVALFVLIVSFIDSINSIPIAISNYNITESYISYLGSYVMFAGGMALGYAGFVFFVGSFAEFVSKEVYPKGTRFFDFLRGEKLHKNIRISVMLGLMLALINLGFKSLFYMIGSKHFGVWKFVGSSYSGVFDNYMPFLAPLAIGVLASMTEELVYRLFLIPSLKKYFRLGVLSLLIPALLWSFAHSTYAIFPVYMRGIELGIIGLIYGLVYIEFGILTVLISHCVYNSIATAIPLLTSGNPYHIIPAVFIILLVPLFILITTFIEKRKDKLF